MCNLMTRVFWSEWRPKSSIKFTMEIHDPERWPRSYLIWHPKQKLILRNPGKMEGAGPLLPSYMGITLNHYKKPLLTNQCMLVMVGWRHEQTLFLVFLLAFRSLLSRFFCCFFFETTEKHSIENPLTSRQFGNDSMNMTKSQWNQTVEVDESPSRFQLHVGFSLAPSKKILAGTWKWAFGRRSIKLGTLTFSGCMVVFGRLNVWRGWW